MSIRIAVIADVHFDKTETPENPARRGDVADILLLRAVHRLNRMVRPDVTLVLGDLIDAGGTPAAREYLEHIRRITDLIESPTLFVPGNHDGDPEVFYSIFERPPDTLDIKNVRFVPFADPEEPGYNARRTQRDLERMAAASAGFDGPIVSVQHVPLFPPGSSACPFNYTNAHDVIAAMQRHGIRLAISGHYHAGMDLIHADGMNFAAAPALCETPFRFLEIALDEEEIRIRNHALQMPRNA